MTSDKKQVLSGELVHGLLVQASRGALRCVSLQVHKTAATRN